MFFILLITFTLGHCETNTVASPDQWISADRMWLRYAKMFSDMVTSHSPRAHILTSRVFAVVFRYIRSQLEDWVDIT